MRLGLCGSWGCAEDASRVALDGSGAQGLLAIGSLAGGRNVLILGRTELELGLVRHGQEETTRADAKPARQRKMEKICLPSNFL